MPAAKVRRSGARTREWAACDRCDRERQRTSSVGVRHQLPAYSPVSARTVAAAFARSIGVTRASRGELAELICREYSAQRVLLCRSGTEALQAAIVAAREIATGEVVALPAFSCFDVASAAVGAGGPVSLYDIDPRTLSPDARSLERALDNGAKVVVVAPLYGIPVDWARIEQIAASHGAVLIEDAAQGHGALYRNRPLGSLGDISTLSFGRGKGWTGGSGGAVLFRRGKALGPTIADASLSSGISSAIKLAAQWSMGRPMIYGIPNSLPGLGLGETIYHEPATPSGMSESAAAAILESRIEATEEAAVRRSNALWIRRQLDSQPLLQPVESEAEESVSGYLRFPVLAPRGIDGFGDGARVLGIAPSYPRPIAELPALTGSIAGPREFPGATRLARELVTLPVHSLLTDSDRTLLIRSIQGYRAR